MVSITDEGSGDSHHDLGNLIAMQKRRKIKLTTFTTSASLILSWPFPIIILSFQANQRLNFDSRIYASLIMSFLLSGSIKRLLIQRFMKPSFLNALIPTILNLIGNSVFMTTLYIGNNWSWLTVVFMLGSRLCFGWSSYSAEDYNRRAKNVAKIAKGVDRTNERVTEMVPDLQDASFHIGVIVALIICSILEVCLRSVGPQMSEFYSMLILSGLSTVLSLVPVPSLHAAVVSSLRNLSNVDIDNVESTSGVRVHATPSNNTNRCAPNATMSRPSLASRALVIRNNYMIGTLFASLTHHQYPPGQFIMMFFSAFLTAATILFDYLVLPYLVVYLRYNLFFSPKYFPFSDFIFIYASLFISELLLRTLILQYTNFKRYAMKWSNKNLIAVLVLVSALSCTIPAILYSIGTMNPGVGNTLFGFCLFLLCVAQGFLKAAHALFIGIFFTHCCYSTSIVPRTVAETGEQLLGVVRCFFAALFFIIGGAVLYHQRFMATLLMDSVLYSLALSTGIIGYAKLYIHEKDLEIRIEQP